MSLLLRLRLLGFLFLLLRNPSVISAQPIITEIMTNNDSAIQDEDGDYSDWIEIFNPSNQSLDLTGWALTDNAAQLGKWRFPAVSVEPGRFLLIWASGKNRRSPPFHTNFSLSKSGEFLALVQPDAKTITQQFTPTPSLASDQSYGVPFPLNPGEDPVVFERAQVTPGTANSPTGQRAQLAEIKWSTKPGFFSAEFLLTLSSASPGVTIRYTTDGSPPKIDSGAIYSKPLRVAKTTTLRSAAFKTGFTPSAIKTGTFLFLGDVIKQSPTGARPSSLWPFPNPDVPKIDYGMDPQIVNSTQPSIGGPSVIKSALTRLPTLSLVTELPNLYDPNSGILVNPGNRGIDWERPCSLELIAAPSAEFPHGKREFQIDCGVRVRGGFSRDLNNPKHSLHFYFREAYGAGKLEYPLFGQQGANEFDQIDLRTSQDFSWSFGASPNTTFLRDESVRQAQWEMGQPASHVRYVHLYLNGQYFGIYDFDERTEANFGATYLGGEKANFDTIKCEQESGYTLGVADGNLDAWTQLWNQARGHASQPTAANYFRIQGLAEDGVTPTADPVLLDVDNLIDYLLLNFWIANADGSPSIFLPDNGSNNWFALRDRTARRGFVFFTHDCENTLGMPNPGDDLDRTGPFLSPEQQARLAYSSPIFLHQDLLANPEYQLRWADRVHKHLFNGGAISDGAWIERIGRLSRQLDVAIKAESARWGDAGRSQPFTRLDWLRARNWILEQFIPGRSATVLAQLRADGLYPALEAPGISPSGGSIAAGSEVRLSAPEGTIYSMPDGSDPRAVGGALRPGAQAMPASLTLNNPGFQTLRLRTFKDNTWSALTEANFAIDTEPPTRSNFAITEIMALPSIPSAAESQAGFQRSDFQFLVLQNFGRRAIDLRGLSVAGAINFNFRNSRIQSLASGQRMFLVANPVAFARRYDWPIDGQFRGKLKPDADRIALHLANGTLLREVHYQASWPQPPSEGGYSWIWLHPNSTADNLPRSWSLSVYPGGNLGREGFGLGSIQFSAPEFSTVEGVSSLGIRIFRSGNADSAARVAYSTKNGTAEAGSDFLASSGILSFAPGQTSVFLNLRLLNDRLSEAEETLGLSLAALSGNPQIGDRAFATVRIQNDDLPENDHFLNGQPIHTGSGTATGNSIGASRETDEPIHGGPGGGSLWYVWVAPASGLVTFDTEGSIDPTQSPLDTLLAVYSGDHLQTLKQLAANDEAEGFEKFSRVRLPVVGGTTYRIAVEGRDQARGTIKLHWKLLSGGVFQFGQSEFRVKEGEPFATITVTRAESNFQAASVHYELNNGTAQANSDYSPISGTLEFAIGQISRSFQIPIFNDQEREGLERLTLTLSQPSPGAQIGLQNLATLTIEDDDDDPLNDQFANSIELLGAVGLEIGDNSGAGLEPSEPEHGTAGGASIWYHWTAPANGVVIFDCSPFTAHFAIYHGISLASLSLIAHSEAENGPTLRFAVTAGTRYQIAIDSPLAAAGPLTLRWELSEADSLFENSPHPQIRMLETYRQSLGSVASAIASLSFTARVSMAGIPLTSISSATSYRFGLGALAISGTLGEDPNFAPGRNQATIALLSQGIIVGSLKWEWNSKDLTLRFHSHSPEFIAAAKQFINQDRLIEPGTDPINLELSFAGVGGQRPIYLHGRASTSQLNGSTLAAVSLSGFADLAPPLIKIDQAINGLRTQENEITLTGRAFDSIRIAGFSLRWNGEEFLNLLQTRQDANSISWSANGLPLLAGPNFLELVAMDASGNRFVQRRVITRISLSPFTFGSIGQGLVEIPGLNLEIGRLYRMRATPKTGWLFSRWSDGNQNPNRSFTMKEGLILEAQFVEDPFSTWQGTYRGLVRSIDPIPAQTGLVNLTIARTGALTGRLRLGPSNFVLRGKFRPDGTATFPISRKGLPALLLSLDLNNHQNQIIGTVDAGTFHSDLIADRLRYDAGIVKPAGRFSVLIRPPAPLPEAPGTGFASVLLSSNGSFRLAGALPDGSPVSAGGSLSQTGVFSLYQSRPPSTLWGCLQFDSQAGQGELFWNRPDFSSATTPLGAQASRYTSIRHQRFLPTLDHTQGLGTLHFSSAELGTLSRAFSLSPDSHFAPVSGPADWRITAKPESGLFSGELLLPGTRNAIRFYGIINQTGGEGAGFLLSPGGNGSIQLGPQ